eukprot:scaffold14867_cov29-Tisochrysis_lutea.AAC.4
MESRGSSATDPPPPTDTTPPPPLLARTCSTLPTTARARGGIVRNRELLMATHMRLQLRGCNS